MPGPARTPTAILKMRGSWRGDIRKGEPRPEKGRPPCPKWLRKNAQLMWKRLVPQLENMGVLCRIDGNALARYCEMWARWREASEFIAKNGEAYPIKDKNGKIVGFRSLPQSRTVSHLAADLLRLEQQFGMSPAARVGLCTGEMRTGSSDDKAARFFRRGG